jgi:hypothetical protein
MAPGGIPNGKTLKWGNFCCHQAGRDWNELGCNEDGQLTGWMAAADIEHPKHGWSPGPQRHCKRGLSVGLLWMSTGFHARSRQKRILNWRLLGLEEAEIPRYSASCGVPASAPQSGGRRPTREGGLPCCRLRTDVEQLEQPFDTNPPMLEIRNQSDLRKVRS